MLASTAPIAYLFINTPLELYIVQFMLGIFTAFTYPTYMAIFTRHIDKNKEGTEWGVYFTLTDLFSAVLGALGGYSASVKGFVPLIIGVSVMGFVGSALLFPIKPYIKMKLQQSKG